MSDVANWTADKKAAYITEILGEAALTAEQKKAILAGIGIGPFTERLRQLMLRAPGRSALPTLMTSPPATAQSAAGAASSIAGSVRFGMDDPGRFRYLGIAKPILSNSSFSSTGRYSKSTDSPWAADFIFDTADPTGRFEVIMVGKNAGLRVLVNGQYVTAGPTFKPGADGGIYRGLVTLGAAGTYRIRLEMDAGVFFRGIDAGPTDTVRATAAKRFRIAFAGDSFTEPTVVDSSRTPMGWDGWAQKLSYMLDADCVSCGSGGTGYVNPGNSPRVKLRDRLTDLTALNADIIVFANGINDYANAAAEIGAQALSCLQFVREQNPNAPVIVVSPFWKAGFYTYPAGLLAASDAILAATLAVLGTSWIDLLMTAVEISTLPASGRLMADAAVNATSISSDVPIPLGQRFRMGTGPNSEVRRSTSIAGTGPYTIGFNGTGTTGGGSALLNAHTAGEIITPCGDGIVTGAGNQAVPNSSRPGNADRYTSSDNTHPTIPGHLNIADHFFRELERVIAALLAATT